MPKRYVARRSHIGLHETTSARDDSSGLDDLMNYEEEKQPLHAC